MDRASESLPSVKGKKASKPLRDVFYEKDKEESEDYGYESIQDIEDAWEGS